MGEFLLYVKDREKAVDEVNMPCMGTFFEVLEQADLEDDWEESIIHCTKDYDLQCKARGPLCEGEAIGDLLLDFEKFLALNRRARDWLRKNPDFDSDHVNDCSSGKTDHRVATGIVENFISNLERLASKKKILLYAEEGMHNSAYPCERNLTVCVSEHAWGLELLDYDYAKEHQDELKDLNIKGWYWKDERLTKKEATEKGIVFTGA